MNKIISKIKEYGLGDASATALYAEILSLMDENKGVVSTSSPESVDLHGVGKSECERSNTAKASDEVVDLPLENRIDSGSFYCQVNDLDQTFGSPSDIKCRKQCVECRAIETKES